MFGHNQDNI